MADFTTTNHGSIVVLNAISAEAERWCTEYLPIDTPLWGSNGYVIEPRYLEPIIDGIYADGLTVE